MNSLVAELSKLSVKERALLDHCKDLLSTNAAMQVIVLFNNYQVIGTEVPMQLRWLFPRIMPGNKAATVYVTFPEHVVR